jgi:hypothetical protein
MLEFGKAFTFLASILSLYWVAINALFIPGSRWEDRLFLALSKLALAAAICLFSGLVFRWPSRLNPDANQPITATLPMRLFFWSTAGIALLFAGSWYLLCAAPFNTTLYPCPACR